MNKEKNEEDILRTRTTRKLYIPIYLMATILIATIAYIKISEKPLDPLAFYLAIGFSIICLLGTEIHRLGNHYTITDNSVVHRKGYFNIISKTMEFGAISDSDVIQNIWQRIFLYGTVEIHMYSRESREVIKNINKPFKFVAFLGKMMKAKGGRQR